MGAFCFCPEAPAMALFLFLVYVILNRNGDLYTPTIDVLTFGNALPLLTGKNAYNAIQIVLALW